MIIISTVQSYLCARATRLNLPPDYVFNENGNGYYHTQDKSYMSPLKGKWSVNVAPLIAPHALYFCRGELQNSRFSQQFIWYKKEGEVKGVGIRHTVSQGHKKDCWKCLFRFISALLLENVSITIRTSGHCRFFMFKQECPFLVGREGFKLLTIA